MADITDEFMMEMMQKTKPYTIVILHKTLKIQEAGAEKIVWEHGRQNFQLRENGQLVIVCPVRDESDVAGVGVFSTNETETRTIMENDPGVQAGIFTYEIHASRSFPGDSLP